MRMTLESLWIPTGVLLGFQMTLLTWRLQEEKKTAKEGDVTWLTPSDYVNLLGMFVFVLGVYVFPILEVVTLAYAKIFFGLGAFLFIGQAMGTAGHYQLFNLKVRDPIWFPLQEKVTLIIFLGLSLVYLVFAFTFL